MNCYVATFLGFGLLGASVYTSLVPASEVNRLRNMVSGEAAEAYKRIGNERAILYIQGLGIGIVLAFLISYYYRSSIKHLFYRTTLFMFITLGFAAFYYSLMPKSDWMLNHLKTEEENKAWLQIYKTMKYRYITGFLFAAIATIPLAYSFC